MGNVVKILRFASGSAGFCLLLTTLFPNDQAPVLPKPDFSNTFYVLVDARGWADKPIEDQTAFAKEVLRRLHLPRVYVRGSFSNGTSDMRACLAVGGHVPLTGTSCARDKNRVPLGDLRFYQWLDDNSIGTNASGICLGRYAEKAGAWEAAKADSKGRDQMFLSYLKQGRASCKGAPIEPRIAEEWKDGQQRFGDYSPFAVAEFRDSITHRGEYGPGGKFQGQGRPGGEVFAEDPSPDQKRPGRAGKTFNETYGTGFKTWELRYWDLDRFPRRLPANAKPMPGAGEEGFVEGGFDAPRAVKAPEKPPEPYWLAWHSNDEKAPGFCQRMVKRYTESMARQTLDAGVPASRIFTHNRSYASDQTDEFLAGADPNWNARVEGINAGFSIYGKNAFDEGLFRYASSIAPDWGLMEYHPFPQCPGGHPAQEYLDSLNLIHKYRGHFVPMAFTGDPGLGGNQVEKGKSPTTFRLQAQETPFEEAMAAFVDGLPDQPYSNAKPVDYAPPDVHGVRLAQERDGNVLLEWSRLIWPDDSVEWAAWKELDHFDVFVKTPGQAPQKIDGTRDYFLSLKAIPAGTLFVRAVSRKKISGDPSDTVRWDPAIVKMDEMLAPARDRADGIPRIAAPFVHPAKRFEAEGVEYWAWRKEAGGGPSTKRQMGPPIPVIFLHGEGTWGRIGVELLRRLVDLHDPENAHRYLVLSPHIEPFHLEGCPYGPLYFAKDSPWSGRKKYEPETVGDTVSTFLEDAKQRFPEIQEGVTVVAQGAGALAALELLRDRQIRVKRMLFWAATQPAPSAPQDPKKRPFLVVGMNKPDVKLLWPETTGQIRSYLKERCGEPCPPQPASVKKALDRIGLIYTEETVKGANDSIDDPVGKRIADWLAR